MQNSRARNRYGKKACLTLRLGSSSSSWRGALVACRVGSLSAAAPGQSHDPASPGPSAEPQEVGLLGCSPLRKPSGGLCWWLATLLGCWYHLSCPGR